MHYTTPPELVKAMREASEKRSELHRQLEKVREAAQDPVREALAKRSQKAMELHRQLQEARDQSRKQWALADRPLFV